MYLGSFWTLKRDWNELVNGWYNTHLENKITIMFTKRNKQDTSGESDFDEFLKVLEDLEDQADHVAIGISFHTCYHLR